MKTSLHGFMKAGLLDYDTKPRDEWVGCHPGQVQCVRHGPSFTPSYVFFLEAPP